MQHTAENIKKLISHKNSVTIQNATWQEKSWELRILANVLQKHINDPHTHNKNSEEILPEACNFRRINDDICIMHIKS